MYITNRKGQKVLFNKHKIEVAILKAMKDCGTINDEVAAMIADMIELKFKNDELFNSVEGVEREVYNQLIAYDFADVAKSYEAYRAVQAFKRKQNTTDKEILALINNVNEEVSRENSNKKATLASTQRDLMAGIISKDMAKRKLIPAHIINAHEEGVLHYHDMDYAAQPIHNCMLINIEDMLNNGTVINDKLIRTPKSFTTACTVVTQIIAQIASGQYGGNSITIKHLAPYLRASYDKYLNIYTNEYGYAYSEAALLAEGRMKEDLKAGIQTIRYQLSTLQTSNGQAPFCTIYLEVEDGHEYEEEMALICEEMLKQRIEGMESPSGNNIGEEFPKLVYLLDENNIHEDSKYYWLTELAAECSAKRLCPDYQSAKIMRQNYDGETFPPMGCRSHLSNWKDENGNYKWYGRFNIGVVSINIPQIAIIAKGDLDKFFVLFNERLELCKEALLVRRDLLKGTKSDISPIHWQHGGIARLQPGETIDKLLENGYATISLGYVGIHEAVQALIGESHTTEEGSKLALKIMQTMKTATDRWKKETGLGFGLYGTPAESLVYRFCSIDRRKFGEIKNVTDRLYYTNSYHVHVSEKIDAFDKLKFESQFHEISLGGCISYIEVPNMAKNIEGVMTIIKYIYDNIQYAEINSRPDVCYKCSYTGEMDFDTITESWKCPQCGNEDKEEMQVMRRTCGYISTNNWNKGKLQEINERVMHL